MPRLIVRLSLSFHQLLRGMLAYNPHCLGLSRHEWGDSMRKTIRRAVQRYPRITFQILLFVQHLLHGLLSCTTKLLRNSRWPIFDTLDRIHFKLQYSSQERPRCCVHDIEPSYPSAHLHITIYTTPSTLQRQHNTIYTT